MLINVVLAAVSAISITGWILSRRPRVFTDGELQSQLDEKAQAHDRLIRQVAIINSDLSSLADDLEAIVNGPKA